MKGANAAVFNAHHPSCPILKQMGVREMHGFCGHCGATKERLKAWDASMQAVKITERCPLGHSYGMFWRRPTKADQHELGLVRESAPKSGEGERP